jgi:hypothetical protein
MTRIWKTTGLLSIGWAVGLKNAEVWAQLDPLDASARAKADRPWFAQFMAGEPVVARLSASVALVSISKLARAVSAR